MKMTIKELYQSLTNEGEIGQQAVKLLGQTHWFTINAVFDPRSGAALPQAISEFISKITSQEGDTVLHDRVWRITEHARESLRHLYSSLNKSPSREQALMPIRSVRELDANSFIKLSNRPGRNIREKLAGKPYLQAVRHFQSVDLPENRLLKEFSIRLVELLEMKSQNLGTQEDPLVQIIHNWLHSDEAQSISRWNNTPPNNTLLSHRDYRRVWDAWRWLQSLDDDIEKDMLHIDERQKIIDFWNGMERIRISQNAVVAELPLFFDYETFRISVFGNSKIQVFTDRSFSLTTSDDLALINTHGRIEKQETILISYPVCVDLTKPKASYASKNTTGILPYTLLWQNWKSDFEDVDIPLFNANAVWFNSSATTVSSTDLFFQSSIHQEYLERAARSFTTRLKNNFMNDTLIWLIPDLSNDFELEILRRNINSNFHYAEPLPRSIAAVIEKINYSSIPKDGYKVIVLDKCNGRNYATQIIAKYSEELKNKVPQTRGYFWERHPTIVIHQENNNLQRESVPIYSLNQNCQWIPPYVQNKSSELKFKNINELIGIDDYDTIITITNPPVQGGMQIYALQTKAQDIPLWRDYLPELAMRVPINGILGRFSLVEKMSIPPLRGKTIPLSIPTKFVLDAGKEYYQFPLIKGNGNDEFHYTAYLRSKDFPLHENIVCRLFMTYEYGANDPYQLRFISEEKINGKQLNVLAEWRVSQGDDIPNAFNYPTFPEASSWNEIIKNKEDYVCFTSEWWHRFENSCEAIHNFKPQLGNETNIECIHYDVFLENKGFGFSYSDNGDKIFCHRRAFVSDEVFDAWETGDEVYALIEETSKGYSAKIIALTQNDIEDTLNESIRTQQQKISKFFANNKRYLHFELYNLFGGLRDFNQYSTTSSLIDDFRQSVYHLIKKLTPMLHSTNTYSEIRREIIMLFSFLHKYAPSEHGEELCRLILQDDWKQYVTEFGYAIGDCTCDWQRRLWNSIISHWSGRGTNIEATDIRIMNIVLLRNPKLMNSFSCDEAEKYLDKLLYRMSRDTNSKVLTLEIKRFIENFPAEKDKIYKSKKKDKEEVKAYYQNLKFCEKLTAQLELLLVILQLRSSSDEKIRMLLYPTSKRTIDFLQLLDTISDLDFGTFSRIKIAIDKPEGAQNTCDLIFALKYYLSGTDATSGIQILEVANEQEEP